MPFFSIIDLIIVFFASLGTIYLRQKDYPHSFQYYQKCLSYLDSCPAFSTSTLPSNQFLPSDIYIGLGFAAYFQQPSMSNEIVLGFFQKAKLQDAPFPYFLKDFLKGLYTKPE